MQLKIFYIDDAQDLCENFLILFSSKETLITTFFEPEEAIKAANEVLPDLVFLDYRFREPMVISSLKKWMRKFRNISLQATLW